MKLPLFLCAFILSIQGWCASVNPSQGTARTITSGHRTIENGKLQEEISTSLPVDKGMIAMIGSVLITYLIAIAWWAIAAKNSLDKILKGVQQDMAQYS